MDKLAILATIERAGDQDDPGVGDALTLVVNGRKAVATFSQDQLGSGWEISEDETDLGEGVLEELLDAVSHALG